LRTSRARTADVDTLSVPVPVSAPDSAQGATSGVTRTLGPFLLFAGFLVVLRSVIIDWNQVPTGSMSPTIAVGDHIIVDKRAYDLRVPFTHMPLWRHSSPQRGDIVAFTSPADGTLYVKRVVGLPGDTVALRDDVLVVNGEPALFAEHRSTDGRLDIQERIGGHQHLIRLSGAARSGVDSAGFGPLKVPPEAYLLMGDNRHESFDSRHFGFVDRDRILGRAVTVVFSLDYDRAFVPRPGRTLIPLN
jgi:signal peptidase I